MVEFSNPLQQKLFDRLVEVGRLDPNNLHISTIETIKSIDDAFALKLLKDFGVKPTIAKKDGGEVKKFQAGGPNFVADPAFDMPNEKFEMSDLTQFVPPHWRGIGEGVQEGLGYLKEKFVERPMEIDYGAKDSKMDTVLNTIEQMGWDISPFYGILRAGKMFNQDSSMALQEYMEGEYGEMGKSVAMAVLASVGMIPVVGTEAKVVRGAIGQTKKAIRPLTKDTVKITSKEDVTPGVTGEPGSVVMSRDGKPLVVAADGTYHPMPIFESKLEKSLTLDAAPKSATSDQWIDYFRKNGVNEREIREVGILDELMRAKEFNRPITNKQLQTMYEESSARNLNIIEKTEGGRGGAKVQHKGAGSNKQDFDVAGENYREVIFQSGPIKGDVDPFVQSGHYSEPNVLAFSRQADYTTVDGMPVTIIQEWQTDMGSHAFKQQKELKKILKELAAQGDDISSMPTSVYRPFPAPEAGVQTIADKINALDEQIATLLPKKVEAAVPIAPGAVVSKMFGQETRGVTPVRMAEPENTTKILEVMKEQQNLIDELVKMDVVQDYLKQMKALDSSIKTFPNIPFQSEMDLIRMTIKSLARDAVENGRSGLGIANSDIVNSRWGKDILKPKFDVIKPQKILETFDTRARAKTYQDGLELPAKSKIVKTEDGQFQVVEKPETLGTFNTKEEAMVYKNANSPQAAVKTVLDEKSKGFKFYSIYDQKIPQVMKEIAKDMNANVVVKDVATGRNPKPFIVKNSQGDIVESFRSVEEAKNAYPQAKTATEIAEVTDIPAAGQTQLPATIPGFTIAEQPIKTQQIIILELNDNFLYPQAIYKRYGGLVESSLKSINDIMRPL